MKNYEIRKINPGSVFKLYFFLGLVIGIIISLVLVLLGVSLNSIGYQLGTVSLQGTGLLQVGALILGIIFGSLVYGLLLAVIAAIGAVIYNVFAAMAGGIVVKLNEKE
jgi:uncharacterized Tic20 family protein